MMRRWDVMIDLATTHQWKTGAEIGVLAGQTFQRLVDQCPNLELWGIDPLTPQPMTEFSDGGFRYKQHDWIELQRNMQEFCEANPRAHWHRMLSEEAAPLFADASLDFVFIDANHDSEHVRQDIMLWTPKVKPTGFVTGHDCNWDSVNMVLDFHCPGWVTHSDNVWSIPQPEVV